MLQSHEGQQRLKTVKFCNSVQTKPLKLQLTCNHVPSVASEMLISRFRSDSESTQNILNLNLVNSEISPQIVTEFNCKMTRQLCFNIGIYPECSQLATSWVEAGCRPVEATGLQLQTVADQLHLLAQTDSDWLRFVGRLRLQMKLQVFANLHHSVWQWLPSDCNCLETGSFSPHELCNLFAIKSGHPEVGVEGSYLLSVIKCNHQATIEVFCFLFS